MLLLTWRVTCRCLGSEHQQWQSTRCLVVVIVPGGCVWQVSLLFQVGFDDSGKIDAIVANVYCGYGWTAAIHSVNSIAANLDNGKQYLSALCTLFVVYCMLFLNCTAYSISNWYLELQGCRMNTPASQPCRSPGQQFQTVCMCMVHSLMFDCFCFSSLSCSIPD